METNSTVENQIKNLKNHLRKITKELLRYVWIGARDAESVRLNVQQKQ